MAIGDAYTNAGKALLLAWLAEQTWTMGTGIGTTQPTVDDTGLEDDTGCPAIASAVATVYPPNNLEITVVITYSGDLDITEAVAFLNGELFQRDVFLPQTVTGGTELTFTCIHEQV